MLIVENGRKGAVLFDQRSIVSAGNQPVIGFEVVATCWGKHIRPMNQVIIRNGLYLINQQVTKGTQGAIACSPAAITPIDGCKKQNRRAIGCLKKPRPDCQFIGCGGDELVKTV